MAELKGGSIMAVNKPLQLQVAASVKSGPFWASTQDAIERLLGNGIRMQGGAFIPWDNVRVGRQVLIRELDVNGTPMSFIVVQSLLNRRFF